jgi:hypothetical protein
MNGKLHLITFMSVYGETTQRLYAKLTKKNTSLNGPAPAYAASAYSSNLHGNRWYKSHSRAMK